MELLSFEEKQVKKFLKNSPHMPNEQRYDVQQWMPATGVNASVNSEGILKGCCPVTRTGIFVYHNADGSERLEYRPPHEVGNEDSLKTMHLVPVMMTHPQEGVVTSDVATGRAIGSTGEACMKGNVVYANLMIFDKDAVKLIKTKKVCELSLGYTADIINQAGEFEGRRYDAIQTNIRYNHLAVVEQARAGSFARITTDSTNRGRYMDQDKSREDEQKIPRLEDRPFNMEKTSLGESNAIGESMVPDRVLKRIDAVESGHTMIKAALDGISKGIGKLHKKMDAMERGRHVGDDDEDEERRDKKKRKKKTDESDEDEDYEAFDKKDSKEKNDSVDPVALHATATRRAKLIQAAERFCSRKLLDRMDGLSNEELRDEVLSVISPSVRVDSCSHEYLNGAFDILWSDLSRRSNPPKFAKADECLTQDEIRRRKLNQ